MRNMDEGGRWRWRKGRMGWKDQAHRKLVPEIDEGVVMSTTGLTTVYHHTPQPILGAHAFPRFIPRRLGLLLFLLGFAPLTALSLQQLGLLGFPLIVHQVCLVGRGVRRIHITAIRLNPHTFMGNRAVQGKAGKRARQGTRQDALSLL